MITEFKDEYRWLSNFEPVEVKLKLDLRLYPSVEHAYQAAKSEDKQWRKFCRETNNPGKVKKAAKKITIRSDWEKMKRPVMWDLLIRKFEQSPFKELLLETGEKYIIEGNTWNDRYWGVCLKTGEGQNVLGHFLMEIRNHLKGTSDFNYSIVRSI